MDFSPETIRARFHGLTAQHDAICAELDPLRAELDACFFHLYGLDRNDTEYVLGTFPIANRKDPGLTARVLAVYDAMAIAVGCATLRGTSSL